MKALAFLRVKGSLRLLAGVLIFSMVAFGQRAEFDFYHDFRNTFVPKLHAENPLVTNDEILRRYAAMPKNEGVADNEIARRTRLIQTERDPLESDDWNRFCTNSKANFNKAPDGFLTQIVEGRTPGVALDYGMGAGRNPIYLARLG